jgi:hypothetical protein
MAIPTLAPPAIPTPTPTSEPSFPIEPTLPPEASPPVEPILLPSSSPTAVPLVSPTGLPSVAPSATPTVLSNPTFSPDPSPMPAPVPTPQLPPTQLQSVVPPKPIRSVDLMKITKDNLCSPFTTVEMGEILDKAVELNAEYIALSTPYDRDIVCDTNTGSISDAVAYTRSWITAARAKNLRVWHRQMPVTFEGIYGYEDKKEPLTLTTEQLQEEEKTLVEHIQTNNIGAIKDQYTRQIVQYILAHQDMYVAGDVFTPLPEPFNGGIAGVVYCGASNTCVFTSKEQFNQWLINVMKASITAFNTIPRLHNAVYIGYWGFSGFVITGFDNPDWEGRGVFGIIDDEVIHLSGDVVAVDHYPAPGESFDTFFDSLKKRFPKERFPNGVKVVIGEYGTLNGGDIKKTTEDIVGSLNAYRQPVDAQGSVLQFMGMNYWHLGPRQLESSAGESEEALINSDYTNRPQFEVIQKFYSDLKE